MAQSKRRCNLKQRDSSRDPQKNYSSDKDYRIMKKKQKVAKMARKRNRAR